MPKAAADAIRRQAERDLIVPNEWQQRDVLLWEHSSAVSAAAERLAALPAVAARSPDPIALLSASLYHDSYFATLHRGRGFRDNDCISRTGDPAARNESAEYMLERLKDLAEAKTLDIAAEALREAGGRDCRRIESQILSDADNLHQVGLLTLVPIIRQSVQTGRAVRDLVERWRVWKEYQVWPARRELFYFEEAREAATRRVGSYDRLIAELDRELRGDDLEIPAATSAPAAPRRHR